MKLTPQRKEGAAYPKMSPMTPPPRATNVHRLSKRDSMALSNTFMRVSCLEIIIADGQILMRRCIENT